MCSNLLVIKNRNDASKYHSSMDGWCCFSEVNLIVFLQTNYVGVKIFIWNWFLLFIVVDFITLMILLFDLDHNNGFVCFRTFHKAPYRKGHCLKDLSHRVEWASRCILSHNHSPNQNCHKCVTVYFCFCCCCIRVKAWFL